MQTNWRVVVLPVLCAVAFVGCSGPQEPTWSLVTAEALSAPQAAQLAKAEQARDGLAKALVGELTTALKSGPAAAVTVCSERAPALATAAATEFGVRIGRTSMSLRNPQNTIPAWAQQQVSSGPAAPTFFAGSGGELATLFPIRLMPQCLQCHGKVADLAADVRAILASKYPADRATGFAAGDLRGWFWVEVPKP